MAHLLDEIGEYEQAAKAFRNAYECEVPSAPGTAAADGNFLGIFPNDVGVAAEQAAQLYIQGDDPEAEKCAREAIRANPNDSLAYDVLIQVMGRGNRREEALEFYDKAPIPVRRSFFVSKSMSLVLAAAGRFEESIRVRNNGLQIEEDALREITGHSRFPIVTGHMVGPGGGSLHPAVSRLEVSSEGGPQPLYLRLERAAVLSGEWYVMDENKTVFLDLNHGTPTGDPTPYYQDPGNSFPKFPNRIVLPEPAREKIDKAILIGGDPNYYQWTVNFLPKLMALGKTRGLDGYPILVHEDIHDYQREGLALAGIAEDRLVRLKYPGYYPCGELIVPLFSPQSPPLPPEGPGLACHPQAVAWLRSLAIPLEGGSRRIYISRNDSKRRRIVNEDVLVAALEKEGFEILELSAFSLKEKIDIFSSAEIVVGCHGAGLADLAFAPSGCRVIEIFDPGWNTWNFKILAGVIGQRYNAVPCRKYHAERTPAIFGDAHITDQTIDDVLCLIRD